MTAQPPTAPQPARPRRAAPRVIAILTASLGCVVVIGALWSGAAPTVAASFDRSDQRQTAVGGASELDINVSVAEMTIRFDDVDDVSLDVRDAGGGEWTLRTDDDALVVRSPDTPFFGWGRGNGSATLTLPRELEGADAVIRLGAGSLTADGEFGELDVEVGAGEMLLVGTARTLSAEIGAGRADLDLDGVTEADFDVSAGAMIARLDGAAPRDVQIAVSAGSLELTLPDEEYDVASDVSAGDFDNGLRTRTGAANQISAEVSAGDLRLIAG